jgi:putative transposase
VITVLKAYKYRIYPTEEQQLVLWKTINGCRYVYNWALEQRKKAYEADEKMPSCFTLNKVLTAMKQDNEWLYESSNPALQFAIQNMDSAYKHFFRRVKEGKEKPGFPRFKSKKNPVQSFQMINNYRVNFEKNLIKLPKLDTEVEIVLDREFEGKMKTGTVSVTSTGKWFVSILVDDGKELPEPEPYTSHSTIGIDMGLTHFAILSDGTKIENPRHLKNSEKRLACLQRRLSRKKKGSQNRKKAIHKVAKMHEKISNQRSDFLHKLSITLIRENQAIAIEDLNVKGMVKNEKLAKHISDASWSTFKNMLEYKAAWNGKTVLKIGRFIASSKLCSHCGYKPSEMSLSVRTWTCPVCGSIHDRDINAAINIKNIALGIDTGANRSGEPGESWSLDRAMNQEPYSIGRDIPTPAI